MAVTGLTCNPPLWRSHRGPPILSDFPPPPHVQPRSGPVPFLRDLISQPYKQNPAAEKTDGGAQVRVFLSLPSVFPAGDHHVLSYGESSGGVTHSFDGSLLLVTIMAAPSRWVVVSVEARSEWDRAENPSSSLSLHAARTQARHLCRRERRPRRDGFTQKAVEEALWLRPECTIPFFWTPRAAAAGLAGAEKGTEEARTRRSVGRSLAGPSRRTSLGLSRPPERVLYLFPVHTSWLPKSWSSTRYLLPPQARH